MRKARVEINGYSSILYDGVTAVYGGWILTTEGGPVCLNILEEAGDQADIDLINRLIMSPSTEWEELWGLDELYIKWTLISWGLLKE